MAVGVALVEGTGNVTMHGVDTPESVCLKDLRDTLLQDLEPKFVVPFLEEKEILSSVDAANILAQDTEENQTRQLIDILCTKGEHGYKIFVESLEEGKAYPWLADLLRQARQRIEAEFMYMHKVLQYGGVPFRPKFVVNREHLVEQVRNALVKVSQEAGSSAVAGVVVVRGMVGSGKSILAAEALRSPSLLSKWFPDGVYWIGIGNLREPRDVLLKMHLQLDRVSPHQHREATTVEIATSRLRHWSINKKVLIILDDVWSAKVVEAFMVGCPLLVTTKDSSVVDELKMNIEWVQVEEGFTLQETKDLFTQVHEAQNGPLVEGIHEAYRGLPLLMANMAAILKQYAGQDRKSVV